MNTSPPNETAAAPRKNLAIKVFGLGNAANPGFSVTSCTSNSAGQIRIAEPIASARSFGLDAVTMSNHTSTNSSVAVATAGSSTWS